MTRNFSASSRRRVLAVGGALTVGVALLPAALAPAHAVGCDPASFAGGDGTQANPFVITTGGQLQAIDSDPACLALGVNFAVASDIDLSGLTFAPIGSTAQSPFQGNLDGGCHTISNLTINWTGNSGYAGLFQALDQAAVGKFRIESAQITHDDAIGILAGETETGTVVDLVSVNGTTDSGTNGVSYQANLIGDADGTTLTRVRTAGSVLGDFDYSGGMIGYGYDLTIDQAINEADIPAADYQVGGIVGDLSGPNTDVKRSYNAGDITALGSLGRVGGIAADTDNLLTEVYSTGVVTGQQDTGGLVGRDTATYARSFWDTQTSGQTTTSGTAGPGLAEGKTTAQMKTAATFTGWDTDVWEIKDGAYPKLKWWISETDNAFLTDCPNVVSSSPSLVAEAGGAVTLTGFNLSAADPSSFMLDGQPITVQIAQDGKSLTFTAPAGTGSKVLEFKYAGVAGMVRAAKSFTITYGTVPTPSGKKAQKLTNAKWAESVAAKGATRVVNLPLRTNAKQVATVRVTCRPMLVTRIAPTGDVVPPCVVVRTSRAVRVIVGGSVPVMVRVVATAPATATHKAMKVSKVWRTI